jgi:hypothetical protein
MKHPVEVYKFWERAKNSARISGDFQDAWGFGDSPELKMMLACNDGKKWEQLRWWKENLTRMA